MASTRKSKTSAATHPEVQQLKSELSSLTRQLRTEMDTVKETVAEMKDFQGFLSEQLDQLQQDVRRLLKDQRSIRTTLDNSQAVSRQLADNVDNLESEVERARRAKNLMVFGYPAKAGEDTVLIVLQVAAVLGCQLPRGAVEEARRLPGSRSQPIRVVFSGERFKREMLQCSKNYGQLMLSMVDSSFAGNWKIFIRDELPQSRLRNGAAHITVDFDEDLRECGNGMPMPDVDVSQFNIIPQDDGTMVLNGTVRINKGFGNPTRWRMYSERLEQGKWNPGIISRDIPNFCAVVQMPTESWYQFTKHLSQGNCPFKAGHEEHMDNLNIGNVADAFNIPAAFIGEWRMFNEITTFRDGRLTTDCYMVPVVIAEL